MTYELKLSQKDPGKDSLFEPNGSVNHSIGQKGYCVVKSWMVLSTTSGDFAKPLSVWIGFSNSTFCDNFAVMYA